MVSCQHSCEFSSMDIEFLFSFPSHNRDEYVPILYLLFFQTLSAVKGFLINLTCYLVAFCDSPRDRPQSYQSIILFLLKCLGNHLQFYIYHWNDNVVDQAMPVRRLSGCKYLETRRGPTGARAFLQFIFRDSSARPMSNANYLFRRVPQSEN